MTPPRKPTAAEPVAAVIGAGSIGFHHLEGYTAAGARIGALCDTNPARLDKMGELFGVPAPMRFPRWEAMLASFRPDILSVCTPNRDHFAPAAAAMKAGIPVLIEKPMAMDLAQARRLAAIARKTRATAMVAFSHRFIVQNMQARALIREGRIGRPFMIRIRYAHSGPYPGWGQSDWFYRPALAGGGALLDMGIHAIDMCHHLVGPIRRVSGFVRTLRKSIKVDDNAALSVEFAPELKCLGHIECGWTSGPGFNGIEVYGDAGTLILELGKPAVLLVGETPQLLTIPLGPSHWPNQMRCWVDHVQGKPATVELPTVQDGLRAQAVATAAVEASRTGRTVRVPA